MGQRYRDQLKAEFGELPLSIDDLFLLEPFQLAGLPERAPKEALAAVLADDPRLRRFMAFRQPSIAAWLDSLEATHGPDTLAEHRDDLVWELADWLVYQRFPEAYDAKPELQFDPSVLREACEGKTVLDVGAGTGWLTEAVAGFAKTVIAVEPVARLRAFIQARAAAAGLDNVHVTDGVLDRIPLPDDSADVLITARAVGWRLEDELREVERVVRPGGTAFHFMGQPASDVPRTLEDGMAGWGYRRHHYQEGTRTCVYYRVRVPDSADMPLSGDASAVTHMIVVSDLARSKAWYVDVLGCSVFGAYGGTSVVLDLAGTWLLLVTGGGPTEDKPQVELAAPAEPNRTARSTIFRVDNCRATYEDLKSRGAAFLTEPADHGYEIRAFFRDPDGHLFEISELVGKANAVD